MVKDRTKKGSKSWQWKLPFLHEIWGFLICDYKENIIFWDIMPCCLVEVNRCFGWANCFHLQDGRVNQASRQQRDLCMPFACSSFPTNLKTETASSLQISAQFYQLHCVKSQKRDLSLLHLLFKFWHLSKQIHIRAYSVNLRFRCPSGIANKYHWLPMKTIEFSECIWRQFLIALVTLADIFVTCQNIISQVRFQG
jgi:hypothetical protein